MSQPIRGPGSHLVFPIGPKNTNLVEDVEILLSVQFRWIPLAVSEKSKMSQSITDQGGHLVFPDRSEKHKLGRGRWDLASCQVSWNSVQRFQRRSRKCLSQSETRLAILFFPIGPKNTYLVEDFEILLPVKFRWIPLNGFREKSNMCVPIRGQDIHLVFPDRSEKHKLGRRRWDLASCQASLNSV